MAETSRGLVSKGERPRISALQQLTYILGEPHVLLSCCASPWLGAGLRAHLAIAITVAQRVLRSQCTIVPQLFQVFRCTTSCTCSPALKVASESQHCWFAPNALQS